MNSINITEWVSGSIQIALALAIIVVLVISCITRIKEAGKTRGIGWQFIRYTVIGISIPLVGILAIRGTMSEMAATAIISGALGYVFAKNEKDEK